MGRSAIVVLVSILLALGIVAAFAPDTLYAGFSNEEAMTAALRTALVGLLVGGAFLSVIQNNALQALKFALIWVIIGAGFLAFYGIRDDIDALLGADNASPPASVERSNDFRPEAPGPRAASLRRENDGHYWADARVDGVRVRFMVDTGASTVALTTRDAQRLGFDIDRLDFSWRVSTAGGETRAASVRLDEIQIGNVTVRDVDAMVMREELEISLLGMTFLNELYSYEFRGGRLIIRQ